MGGENAVQPALAIGREGERGRDYVNQTKSDEIHVSEKHHPITRHCKFRRLVSNQQTRFCQVLNI
jgi:hypothetical protein